MEFFFQQKHCCNANCNSVSAYLCSPGVARRRAPRAISSPFFRSFSTCGDSSMCQYRILTLSSVLALSCVLSAPSRAAEPATATANSNAAAPDAQTGPSDAAASPIPDAKATQSMDTVVVTGRAGVDLRTKEQTSYS